MSVSGSDKQYSFICVSVGNIDCLLSVLYRPPCYKGSDFLNELKTLLARYPRNHIVIGDFNINVLDQSSLLTKEYNNILVLNGYSLVNDVSPAHATRVSNRSISIIDHVVCSSTIRNKCKVIVEENHLSDHDRQLILNVKLKVKQTKQKTYFEKTIVNVEKFRQFFFRRDSNSTY